MPSSALWRWAPGRSSTWATCPRTCNTLPSSACLRATSSCRSKSSNAAPSSVPCGKPAATSWPQRAYSASARPLLPQSARRCCSATLSCRRAGRCAMAGAAWMRIKRLDQDDVSLSGTLLRAAARGETIGMILEQAARGLLLLGAAERAGVWVESTQHPNIFKGAVVEAGSGPVPEQWKRLDVSVPFFRTLLGSENPIIEEFGDAAGASLIGALAGMRSAAWIPLRVQQKTLGLTLVAYGRSRRAVHTPKLRRLADELALVIAQRRDRELCRVWRAEIVSRCLPTNPSPMSGKRQWRKGGPSRSAEKPCGTAGLTASCSILNAFLAWSPSRSRLAEPGWVFCWRRSPTLWKLLPGLGG